MDDYLTDQLNYNYNLLQSSPGSVDTQGVQLSVSILNAMTQLTKDNQQLALNTKLLVQLNDYTNKFSALMGKQ